MAQLKIDLVLNRIQAMTGLRSFESNVMSIGKRLAGFVGIGGGIAGITTTIQGLLDKASRLQDVSDAFNVSAESIQRLGNAGVTANLSIEEIGSKLGKLAKAAQEAAKDTGGELAAAFVKIGVSVDELNKLSPEQLFDRLREAVSSGKLAGEEFSVVGKLLAKDFQRLMPILRMTAEEFNTLGQAGGIMSDAVVSSLDAANVKIKLFQEKISKIFATAVADVLSLFTILKESPQLALDLVTKKDTSALEEFGKKYTEMQNKINERILAERKARRGEQIDEPEIKPDKSSERASKELASAEERYAEAVRRREMASQDANEKIGRTQAELIALQSDAAMLADNTAAKYEKLAEIEAKRLEIMGLQNDAADEQKRLMDEQARAAEKAAEVRSSLEAVIAQRGGPEAELELLKKRGQEAIATAGRTMDPADILAAAKARQAVEEATRRQLESSPAARAGFLSEALIGEKAMAAGDALGNIQGLKELLADTAMTGEAAKTQPREETVQKISSQLSDAVKRLDDLIRSAGTFGI